MKTYTAILNRSALALTTVLVFCTANANAEGINPFNSDEEIMVFEEKAMPPATLQVNLIPYVYNGNVNIRCNGTNTGRVTAQVTGGVAPYSYAWSSGIPLQGGALSVGLYAGTVSVTVTDALGNSATQSVTLTQNPPLQAIANVDPILCHGGVATIILNATGGTMPYNGLNSYQFAAGTYDFTVADANGCRNEVTTVITEPPVLNATSIVAAPILCHGDATSVIVEATGGVGSYTGTGVHSALAGNSSYVITDGNGCYAYTSVFINQPLPLAAVVSSPGVACRGEMADIAVSGIGGVAPYSGIGNFTAISGNMTYTITDANGCQASSSIQITQPPALVATISNTPIACSGDLSAVQVSANGGTAPYVGPGVYYEPAGPHWYTVTDANGCSVDIMTFIVEPKEIEVNVSWLPLGNNSTTDVVVSAYGGTPAYVGTGVYVQGPGTHVYTVYDANGCTGTEMITIAAPSSNTTSLETVMFESNSDLKSNDIAEGSFVQGAFNTGTSQVEITYDLTYDSDVAIELYNMSGALVESVVVNKDVHTAGNNTISMDTDELTSGMYLFHFVTNSERQVGKLQIVQ